MLFAFNFAFGSRASACVLLAFHIYTVVCASCMIYIINNGMNAINDCVRRGSK